MADVTINIDSKAIKLAIMVVKAMVENSGLPPVAKTACLGDLDQAKIDADKIA